MIDTTRSKVFKILFVGGLSWLCAVSIALIGGLFFGDNGTKALRIVSGSDQHFFIQLFYNRVNYKKCNFFHNDLVLVDVTDIDSRNELADWIDTIYSFSPAAICLDITHVEIDDIDSAALNKLATSIYKSKDKFVAPCYSTVYESIYPFYFDSNQGIRDSVLFANVALLGDFYYQETGGSYSNGVIKFAYAALEKAGKHVELDKVQKRPRYINFRTKIYNPIDEFTDLSEDRIKQKIVLIGNFSGSIDCHFTPFLVNGKESLYGSEIHAYSISCLLADIDKNLSRKEARFQQSYYKMSGLGNGLLTLFLAIIYSSLFIALSEAEDLSIIKRDRKRAVTVIISKGLLFYISEALIFLGCMLLTAYTMMIPNLLLFMAAIFFVDIFNKLFNLFFI